MSKSGRKVPAYSRHKASGQAVVRIAGKDHYLGRYGTPESHEAYRRLIATIPLAPTPGAAPQVGAPLSSAPLTVSQVLLRYQDYARGYYSADGAPTAEYTGMGYALRPVRELYGSTPASEFGPRSLKLVRQHLIDLGRYCRSEINKMIRRIVRCFRWLASEELVPSSVYEGLRSVSGLRAGKTTARERDPVKPVPDAWIEATLPYLSPTVRAMVQVQRLTGMRPSEVTLMRGCDIEMSGEIWLYRLAQHKNAWRGHSRTIAIGPKAQAIIRPFLQLQTEAYLFSPQQAEAERNEARRAARKTPMTPSQAARRPKSKPIRAKRERYDRDSYRRAITYAITRANKERPDDDQIPSWCPLQLRHSRGTEVRKKFGLEAAQVALGHAHANVTEIYAEKNLDLALQVARATG